jgi:hypothetical protein
MLAEIPDSCHITYVSYISHYSTREEIKCTEELKKFHAVTEITLLSSLTIFELLGAITAPVSHRPT